MTTTLRPPIPVTCADRPLTGGLVCPYVNVQLADGGADFRTAHHTRYEKCWTEGRCQTCGSLIAGLAVLFGGPNQLRTRQFTEPPLCAPGCECGGFVPADPAAKGSPGDPAHPWYALYVRPGSYAVTGNRTTVRCSDLGCEHERLLVNGALLTGEPLKGVLVSEPGGGRIWKRLDAPALAALLGPVPDLSQRETAVLP